MAKNDDWLGGYTMQELLGAVPVSKSPKQIKQEKKAAKKASGKRGVLSTVFGAPFRLVAALVKLPVTLIGKIVKLPARLVGFVLRPFRKRS